jgi:poly(3-hydroxyalkanoate) synthetase
MQDSPIWLRPLEIALDSAHAFAASANAFTREFLATKTQDEIDWFSPGRVIADFTSMRLREFESGDKDGVPILIEAPYAIHDTALVDLADGHSIVQAITSRTRRRVLVTEWKSARPSLADLSIDTLIADLNAAVDLIGGKVDLLGLCQGGWMALAFASAFPHKVRRLALVGAPIDIDASPSLVSSAARSTPGQMIEQTIQMTGGIVQTGVAFSRLIAESESPDAIRAALQIDACNGLLTARFRLWNRRNFDLPGVYFAQVNNWIFRENRIARGTFQVFGRTVTPRSITSPMYLMAGELDDFAPLAQALAASDLVATSPDQITKRVVPGSTHLGLFLGARTLRDEWPTLIEFFLKPSRQPGAKAGRLSRAGPHPIIPG